eukprot:1148139-Pelagomonas_calceolata.AAC.1
MPQSCTKKPYIKLLDANLKHAMSHRDVSYHDKKKWGYFTGIIIQRKLSILRPRRQQSKPHSSKLCSKLAADAPGKQQITPAPLIKS